MNHPSGLPHTVLVDARALSNAETGTGRYRTNLLAELARLAAPEFQVQTLRLAAQTPTADFPSLVLSGLSAAARPLSVAQQFLLPRIVARSRCDLFHYQSFDPPAGLPRPFVATCYDLEPLRHPELFRRRIVAYYRFFAPLLRRADRVAVISHNTKRDVVEILGIPPDRVRVIYLAVESRFGPVAAVEKKRVGDRYRLPERFVLYVGNTMPHKNLPRLVQAMAQLRQLFPQVPLLLAGGRDRYRSQVEGAIRDWNVADSVKFLGRIPEADLPGLYANSSVFVYPSLYEGFGLPVLEAMACGTPVVTSNCSSLPEVAGPAAIQVDPREVDAITAGLAQVLSQPEVASRLSAAGPPQASQFSWRRCAEEHLALYREVLEG